MFAVFVLKAKAMAYCGDMFFFSSAFLPIPYLTCWKGEGLLILINSELH